MGGGGVAGVSHSEESAPSLTHTHHARKVLAGASKVAGAVTSAYHACTDT